MSVAYKDVLERFVKYREQRNISQNELCTDASHFTKLCQQNGSGKGKNLI